MFGNKDGKPVDLEITEHTYVEGKVVEAGSILREAPYTLALELVGAGRARAATAERIAALEAKKKAAAK